MGIGAILALLVLVIVVVALVFITAVPAWLSFVLIGALALAMLVGGYTIPIRT